MYKTIIYLFLFIYFIVNVKSEKSFFDSIKVKKLETLFHSFSARSIGPAIMGGRVSDIAFDPNDSFTHYIALGTGGVMKTTDDGATYLAIFEKENVAAIGDIAVSKINPKHIWIGTGEANDRNSSSWGDGIYFSNDGGSSWKNMGLKETKTISRIVIHPQDTNIIYVAAMGDLWNKNSERGLFKTNDGGKSWEKILFNKKFSDIVGCGDVVVSPNDGNVVYAVLYARQRKPWSFQYGINVTNGEDVCGIFKSTDGGKSWKNLENGLPKITGRIGLSIYEKNPNIVYAIIQSDEGGTTSIDNVQSKKGGIFKSTDGGENWERVNALNPRPFYFSQIRIDPNDSSKIFVLGFTLHFSNDGGKTFREEFAKKIHPDCHALEFDPKNSKRILLGTDGGAYISFNSAKTWIHLNKYAAGEFYRITYDMSVPYRIAGGLQDNQNWLGKSETNTKDGILNSDWTNIGGGDGFYCVFDDSDSNTIYAEAQEGYVYRINLKTGEAKSLRPSPQEGQSLFRFHWNSPLIGSRHQKGVLYLAGNRVFKLQNKGDEFEVISNDLSQSDKDKILITGSGAENFGVVYSLVESPIKSGFLVAGTDDGKLWFTENDGKNWSDLTSNLPKEIQSFWISRIEPSHFDENIFYIVVDGHRSGSYFPFIYKTNDKGKSWKKISSNLPKDEPMKVVREDWKNKNLLFAGGEFHLYISTDGGSFWTKFGNLPTVAIDDIQIHERESDLIIATHGRSIYIIDDISSLQEFSDSVEEKSAHLFSLKNTFANEELEGFSDWSGEGIFRGANPQKGGYINYYIKENTNENVSFTISDANENIVANLNGSGNSGFNRIVWNMKWTNDLLAQYGSEGQKFVKSGEYTLKMNYGKISQKQKIKIEVPKDFETK